MMSDNVGTEKNSDIETNAFTADNEAPKFYTQSDEEFASEVADVRMTRTQNEKRNQIYTPAKEVDKGRGWGLTAVVLSIAAWFIWPSLLAPAAVITGLVAFLRGRRGLGSVAIAVGLIAFFSNMGNAIL